MSELYYPLFLIVTSVCPVCAVTRPGRLIQMLEEVAIVGPRGDQALLRKSWRLSLKSGSYGVSLTHAPEQETSGETSVRKRERRRHRRRQLE